MSRIFCLLAALFLFGGPGLAQDDGVPHRVDYQGTMLALNGYGEREVMWMDVYRCALYLARPSSDPAEIIKMRDAKLLRVQVLIDGAPDEMPQRWRETLDEELTGRLFRRIKKAYRRASAGDELTFAYLPGTGTTFYFNGERIFNDPGYGLMESLLDQWMGARPVSRNLKRLLASAAPGS